MVYQFTKLHHTLVYIAWKRSPSTESGKAFIQALKQMLDQATEPLYFISDLRRGQIVDIRIIHQLIGLTQHRNWAGSTAFSQNPISRLFLGSFHKMLPSGLDKNATFDRPEEAIAFLEHLCPGLTASVNWPYILEAESRGIAAAHD